MPPIRTAPSTTRTGALTPTASDELRIEDGGRAGRRDQQRHEPETVCDHVAGPLGQPVAQQDPDAGADQDGRDVEHRPGTGEHTGPSSRRDEDRGRPIISRPLRTGVVSRARLERGSPDIARRCRGAVRFMPAAGPSLTGGPVRDATPVAVRDACPDDLPACGDLWDELRDMGGRIERAMPAVDRGWRAASGCGPSTPTPRSCALVAVVDDEAVGHDGAHATSYAPLFDQRAVHVHYLHVRDGSRRRGVGKALLAAAAAYADDFGAEHVITSVPPHLRETQPVLRPARLRPGRGPPLGAGQHPAAPARGRGYR